MSRQIYEIPYGTKDILPGEMKTRRAIENRIINVFCKWGYDEVKTPSFEYADIFKIADKESDFRFFDRNNNLLALRNDMTAPIARVAANRLQDENKIKRLCYISSLYRYENIQAGKQCEFEQAGVELFGASGAAADAEVIVLAAESLQAAGIKNFSISLGHIGFIDGLCEEAGLNAAQVQAVKESLRRHDAVALENAAAAMTRQKPQLQEIFSKLLFLQGRADLLERLESCLEGRRVRKALADLRQIYQLVEAYGYGAYVNFDLGLNRSLDYYTGMLFEIYLPEIGFSVAGGGRYDKMMDNFGLNCPATGFALGIERVILALERQGALDYKRSWDVFVAWGQDNILQAIAKANALRQEGRSVKLAVEPMTLEQAAVEVGRNCCSSLVYV